MSTHKCAIDWGIVGGPDLKVDGTTDIDTERRGIGCALTGREEAVDEIECWGLDRRVGFTSLR